MSASRLSVSPSPRRTRLLAARGRLRRAHQAADRRHGAGHGGRRRASWLTWGRPDRGLLLHTLLGTLLVAASASAVNQWLERRLDGCMRAHRRSSAAAGRLSPRGSRYVLPPSRCSPGLAWLLGCHASAHRRARRSPRGCCTCWVYTPLKTRTPLEHGRRRRGRRAADADRLDAPIGCARSNLRACALFVIVFLWQFPHFMAIAWLYRQQYARPACRCCPPSIRSGRWAGAASRSLARPPWCR